MSESLPCSFDDHPMVKRFTNVRIEITESYFSIKSDYCQDFQTYFTLIQNELYLYVSAKHSSSTFVTFHSMNIFMPEYLCQLEIYGKLWCS